ncbi:hypothetical protein JL720_6799 [Aureococcus anophagefferens]|nr:hypothetical protein JL720_6799 [Aureococcus anophagefferens]
MGEEVPARAAAEEPPPPGLPLSRSPRRPPPIEFLQRCDSKVTPVYDINVTGSSGLDGAAVRRRRRRSSSAEDLQRLERLKEIRESMKTESPRKPSSIHTDTLSPRRSFELDEFRTEELARIAAGERDRVSFARGTPRGAFSPGGTAQVTIDVDVGSPLAPPDPKKDRVSFAQAPEEPQSPPTPTDPGAAKPTRRPWCADDEAWFHAGAPWKHCAWVFASPDHRCGAVGDDGSLASTKCLESCGRGSLGDLVAYQVGTKGGCGDGGWVLFYNDGDDDVELAPGTALASGAATHVFSGGDVVPAGGFLKVPAACDAPFDVGDHVLLVDESGAVVEEAAGLARDTPGFPTVWARGADGGFTVDGYESSAIYGGFGACFADCGEDCGVFEAGECASTCSSDERDFLAYQCEHVLSSDGPPDLACLEGCAAYDAETPPCGWFDADLACAATCAEDVLVFVSDYCDEYSVDWVAIFGEADKTRRFPASATVSVVWASGKHDVYLMAGKDRWEACDFEGAEFLGDASGVPLEGTAGDVTYAACSVGSHCASGQKVAVAWTGPAAATVSATVVLAGVDAADFNADEEAKDAFRVAVAHTANLAQFGGGTALEDAAVDTAESLVALESAGCPAKRGEIAEFKPAQVISCWKYALQDMRPGDVWELVCPPETAYGKKGSPSGAIGGGATLVFTVELVWVGSAPSPTRAPGSDDFLIDALFDDAVGSFDRTPTKRPTLRPNSKTPRPVAAPGDDGDDDLVMSASADLEDLFSNTFVLGVTIWAVTFCALGYFVYLKMKAKDEKPAAPVQAEARARVAVTIDGPSLGLAFGPDGAVRGVQPGGEGEAKGVKVGEGREARGEAETLGLQYSDKVVKVGDVWCEGEDEIKAAVAAHPQRPITITVARKKPKRAEPDEDPKRERVPLTFEGPTLGIAFCPNGTPGMLQPGGEAETLGLQYSDKVIKVGETWCEGEDEIKAAGPIIEQRDTDGDLDEIIIEYLDDDLERA